MNMTAKDRLVHNLIAKDHESIVLTELLIAERDAYREALEHLAAQTEDSRCKPDGYAMEEYARAALRSIDKRE